MPTLPIASPNERTETPGDSRVPPWDGQPRFGIRALQAHSFEATLGAVVSLAFTFILLQFDNSRAEPWNLLIPILISIVVGTATGYVRWALSQLTMSIDSRGEIYRQARITEIELDRTRNSERGTREAMSRVLEYLAVSEPPVITDGPDFLRQLRAEQIVIAEKLSILLSQGAVSASYDEQLDFAGIFSLFANWRFGATSCDRPSIFSASSYRYLDKQRDLPNVLANEQTRHPELEPNHPSRVFVGSTAAFLDDLLYNYGSVVDLYARHYRWRGSGEAAPSLRFFSYRDTEEYEEYFRNLSPTDRIHDFMIVDDRFVYGRRSGIGQAGREVELAYRDHPDIVAKYIDIYQALWRTARPIEGESGLIDKLKEEFALSESQVQLLVQFAELCENRKSKMAVEKDYGEFFPKAKRIGYEFFKEVCTLIGQGTGLCFAIDRADKKTGDLLSAWSTPEYREFKVHSIAAVQQHGAQFRRLFILQRRFDVQKKDRMISFVREFTDAGIVVGFLFQDDADLGRPLDEYGSDFIIVGLNSTDAEDLSRAFGFELGNEPFQKSELRWDDHLIGREQLLRHKAYFERLWANEKTITIYTSVEVDDAVGRLITPNSEP